jgi:hypothetical protein
MDRVQQSPGPEGEPEPQPELEVTIHRSRSVWVQIAGDAFLGITSLLLAISPSFAEGRVVFAEEGWRLALGGVGVLFTFIFLRAVFRLVTRYRPRPGRGALRGTRIKSNLLFLIGLFFLGVAVVPALAERTISFIPWWLKVGYGIAGAMNLTVGLVIGQDPTRLQRQIPGDEQLHPRL